MVKQSSQVWNAVSRYMHIRLPCLSMLETIFSSISLILTLSRSYLLIIVYSFFQGRNNINIGSGSREMATILDTTLIQALLLTGQSSNVLELSKDPNYCDVKICEEFLQQRNYFKALLELYKSKEMHREALKLLIQLVEDSKSDKLQPESTYVFRPDMIIEYLKVNALMLKLLHLYFHSFCVSILGVSISVYVDIIMGCLVI